ncbi:MAG: flippase-like domain-containing protein [Magnetococcales bacterium]|nr:flippase-like domain-containing protein [Magnetococcales bacterium]
MPSSDLPRAARPPLWHRLLPWLKLAVTVGLIGWLWQRGTLDFSAVLWLSGSPGIVAGVIALSMIMYALTALRWNVVLRSQHIVLPFSWAHRVTYLGLFGNLFLPGGGMAGDALRMAAVLRAAPEKRLAGVLTLFVDRAVGLYAMLFIAMVAIILNPALVLGMGTLRVLAMGVVAVVIGLPVATWSFYRLVSSLSGTPWFERLLQAGRIGAMLRRLIEIARLYRDAWKRLIWSFVISLGLQVCALGGVVWVAGALALGTLTPLEYTFATPWAWMANFLPLTPGGIGVGEAAFDHVCRWIETTPSGAAYGTIFLVVRILTMVATFPGLVLFSMARGEINAAETALAPPGESPLPCDPT